MSSAKGPRHTNIITRKKSRQLVTNYRGTLTDCRHVKLDGTFFLKNPDLSMEEEGRRWDMEFNPSKCQVLSVTSSRTPLETHYILHGQVLEAVSSDRYLGWISPASSTRTLMWTESQPTQTGSSDLLSEISKLSPSNPRNGLSIHSSSSAGVCFSSVGPPYQR